MGKKSKGSNLGKALIRDRFGPSRKKKHNGESYLHTADLDDGYDWGRLNLQSVTEESSFQEFLSTAELAGTEFHAEKLNIKFVNPKSGIGLLTNEERQSVLKAQEQHKNLLKIPRRPKWDKSTTAEELQSKEKQEFLEWRRQLVVLQEAEGLLLTPYEKNLEFWRQLWRVIERSDVVVQIVDARNPLLFRCEDLEKYVTEVDSAKMNMLLLNKADFLTNEQRKIWADYFSSIGVRAAFFSATQAVEKNIEEESSEDESEEKSDYINNKKEESEDESNYTSDFISDSEYESANDNLETYQKHVKNGKSESNSCENLTEDTNSTQELGRTVTNSSKLLSREELITLFKTIYKGNTYTEGITTIGLVGYPNVGKSSTINALLMDKKVSVSATPGKTKHFQTLFVDKDLLLCDCPGLVMPSFICTKAEMILNGILPIDQMRDHVPPVTLLGTLIPRHKLEDTYGIVIPPPMEGEDANRSPTSEEILNAYGYNRGFMTQNGQPDNPRSARYILKDFVNGKLLYCVAPPGCCQESFHKFPPRQRVQSSNKQLPPRTVRATRSSKPTSEDVDTTFFKNNSIGVHTKGKVGILGSMKSDVTNTEKPWKKINKHANKKKREKTRRLFAHLDQH